jgi:hypothetical protein
MSFSRINLRRRPHPHVRAEIRRTKRLLPLRLEELERRRLLTQLPHW